MNLFLTCVRVSKKKGHFQLKAPMKILSTYIVSFTFSSALLSADTHIASYPPEFH